ncbi:unnamed protein product [Aphanomyces euteiches]
MPNTLVLEALLEVDGHQEIMELFVPLPRRLLESIQRLLEKTDIVWPIGIHEAFWLNHVKECDHGAEDSKRPKTQNRGKGVSEVHTRNLEVSFDDQASFEALNVARRAFRPLGWLVNIQTRLAIMGLYSLFFAAYHSLACGLRATSAIVNGSSILDDGTE